MIWSVFFTLQVHFYSLAQSYLHRGFTDLFLLSVLSAYLCRICSFKSLQDTWHDISVLLWLTTAWRSYLQGIEHSAALMRCSSLSPRSRQCVQTSDLQSTKHYSVNVHIGYSILFYSIIQMFIVTVLTPSIACITKTKYLLNPHVYLTVCRLCAANICKCSCSAVLAVWALISP